jgi:acetoin utilization protein AcuB
MKVVDSMTPNPVHVTPNDTLATARALMDPGDFRCLPVVEGGKLVGIITDRDIRKHADSLESTNVVVAMTREVVCISPDDTVNEAVRSLLAYKIGGLPVIRKDKLVGIITTTDILKAVLGLPELDK